MLTLGLNTELEHGGGNGQQQPVMCFVLLQGTFPSCPGEAKERRAEHAQEAG